MQTIVYKGMLRSAVMGDYFKDLKDPAFETAFAIYHRRFSTNTNPKWPLAQPMRVLGHNGEINTLQVYPSPCTIAAACAQLPCCS
jgi:glutamate synthase (ferredoxin)